MLGLGLGTTPATVVAVEATDPAIRFVVEIDESVSLRDGGATGVPCLRGDAVALVEALSLRAPMPASIPAEWSLLLAGLATAFDAVAKEIAATVVVVQQSTARPLASLACPTTVGSN